MNQQRLNPGIVFALGVGVGTALGAAMHDIARGTAFGAAFGAALMAIVANRGQKNAGRPEGGRHHQ